MKVILSDLISSLSGTIDGITYVTRNGKTFAYKRRPTQPRKHLPQAIAAQNRFALVQKQTTEILHSTFLKAKYEAEWKKQKRYPTLRGYIFHCLYAQ